MVEKIRAVLTDYLDDDGRSPEQAAQSLLSIVKPSDEDAAYSLFNNILSLVRSPQATPSQLDRLTSLLLTLKSSWPELAPLGMLIRELWNVSGPGEADWKNINAFAAKLETAKVLDLQVFGIWAMREAFEYEGDDQGKSKVEAAAMWIQYAGSRIYELSIEEAGGTTATRGGPLWDDGQNGYSRQRWAFWKQRLEEIGRREEGDAKETAENALRKMEEVQGVNVS